MGLVIFAVIAFVVVGAAVEDGKASFVVATDAAAKSQGASASAVLAALLPAVGGKGGGNARTDVIDVHVVSRATQRARHARTHGAQSYQSNSSAIKTS